MAQALSKTHSRDWLSAQRLGNAYGFGQREARLKAVGHAADGPDQHMAGHKPARSVDDLTIFDDFHWIRAVGPQCQLAVDLGVLDDVGWKLLKPDARRQFVKTHAHLVWMAWNGPDQHDHWPTKILQENAIRCAKIRWVRRQAYRKAGLFLGLRQGGFSGQIEHG